MDKAKVYWCDFRTGMNENLMHKMMRLAEAAGIGNIDFDLDQEKRKAFLTS